LQSFYCKLQRGGAKTPVTLMNNNESYNVLPDWKIGKFFVIIKIDILKLNRIIEIGHNFIQASHRIE